MALWTPPQHVDGTDAETGQINTQVIDNLHYLNERLTDLEAGLIDVSSATVATAESTSSTTYTDLTTVGPTVTVTTGARVMLWLSASLSASTAPTTAYMSVAVSGATTIAAGTYVYSLGGQNIDVRASRLFVVSGLTPGSHTFTAKYRISSGSARTFEDRRMTVRVL